MSKIEANGAGHLNRHDPKGEYANKLAELNKALMTNNLAGLKAHIRVYRQAYAYMDNCKRAAKDYYEHFHHVFHPLLKHLDGIPCFKKILEKDRTLQQHVQDAADLYAKLMLHSKH